MKVAFSFLLTRRLIIFLSLIIFFFSILGCGSTVTSAPVQPDTLIVRNKELIPEGIAIHPHTGVIYLTSLHLNKIVSLDKDGNCKNFISSGQDGFMRGLGIKISKDGNTLWACSASLDSIKSVSGLFQIDLATGKVIQSYLHQSNSGSLFNDLAIHSSGDVYITDTYQGTIFRYQPVSKTIESWLRSDQLTFANGIAFSDDEKTLFVASGNKGVQRIALQTKEITSVSQKKRTDYAIDGLVYINKTLVGVIGWPQEEIRDHRVIRYYLNDSGYFKSADTLLVNEPYLNVPTTAAVHNNRLYILGITNLGLYNRGGQDIKTIKDSLQFPVIVQIPL